MPVAILKPADTYSVASPGRGCTDCRCETAYDSFFTSFVTRIVTAFFYRRLPVGDTSMRAVHTAALRIVRHPFVNLSPCMIA
jgi:hypothetical protein